MKILALDSSGLVASVAIVTEESVLAEYTLNFKKTHSQTLLPMLDEIVSRVELDLNQIDAIAISSGPGSFTGLRIGSATAKGLGLALNKPIIPVPTLEGLAYNLFGTEKVVCPMMDARRNQVYTGLYEVQGEELNVIHSQTAIALEEILSIVKDLNREVIFLGDGADVHKEVISRELKEKAIFAPMHLNKQRAGALGALAIQYYMKNLIETATEHEPVYLRLSQAERELAEKNRS